MELTVPTSTPALAAIVNPFTWTVSLGRMKPYVRQFHRSMASRRIRKHLNCCSKVCHDRSFGRKCESVCPVAVRDSLTGDVREVLHEIPPVAVQVDEHDHPSVGFLAWLLDELHAASAHDVEVVPEVIRFEE